MRIFITTLLLLLLCPFTNIGFADEKSDCLNSCANDKRASDMYCPPAGGYTDEENKQCVAKNNAEYNSCKNSCSPPASPPVNQGPPATEAPDEAAPSQAPADSAKDKQD